MYSRISITSISHAPSTFNKKCSILSFLGIYNLFMICGWYGMSHAIHFLFFPLIRTRNLKSYVVSSNIHTSISRPGHFPLIFRISCRGGIKFFIFLWRDQSRYITATAPGTVWPVHFPPLCFVYLSLHTHTEWYLSN